jgi:hypothetical protein
LKLGLLRRIELLSSSYVDPFRSRERYKSKRSRGVLKQLSPHSTFWFRLGYAGFFRSRLTGRCSSGQYVSSNSENRLTTISGSLRNHVIIEDDQVLLQTMKLVDFAAMGKSIDVTENLITIGLLATFLSRAGLCHDGMFLS